MPASWRTTPLVTFSYRFREGLVLNTALRYCADKSRSVLIFLIGIRHRKRIYKRPPVCESEVKPNKPALNLSRQSRYKVSDIPSLKRSREKIRRRRVKDTATRRARGSLLPIEIFLKLNSLVNWEIKSFLKRQRVPGVGRDHSFRSHFRGCSIWLLFLLLFPILFGRQRDLKWQSTICTRVR